MGHSFYQMERDTSPKVEYSGVNLLDLIFAFSRQEVDRNKYIYLFNQIFHKVIFLLSL